MSNLKYTPGPWVARKHSIQAESGRMIATLSIGDKTCKANARLIAVAPELLEALIEATKVLRQFGGISGDPFKYDKLICKAVGGAE